MTGVAQLVVGPDEHGVVRFGRTVLTGLRAMDVAGPVVETTASQLRADLDGVLAPLSGTSLVHVQFTDRLFGARCEQAADLVALIAAALSRHGAALSATLHDLPDLPDLPTLHDLPDLPDLPVGPDLPDGPDQRERPDLADPPEPPGDPLTRRRALAYARVVSDCAGIVVCSQHERARLEAILGSRSAAPPVRVIPLPVDPPTGRPVPHELNDVTVLGFLYPGKGHAEVLRAMAGLPGQVGMTALGRPSDGHDDLIPQLQGLARELGRGLRVTGFVPDPELPAALQSAGVPVAPHRTVSASGSIATWLGAGRRPLVPDVPYTRELAQRCPGALWPYDPDDPESLSTAQRGALAEPERNWLDGIEVGPSTAEVVAAYAATLAEWS